MNIVYFIRLLFKNVWLILSMACLMAGLVYVLTRNEAKIYTTSSTIYTGIATGFDIESGVNSRFDLFANNAQFDNLINIIKSRETHEKTAIRLMAQHLMLIKPDPAYCLPKTWQDLMSEIPIEVKMMAENSLRETTEEPAINPEPALVLDTTALVLADSVKSEGKEVSTESKTVTEKIKRFRTKTDYYTIKAGDNPNLVCQKFNLTYEELKRLNSPMPPFHGGQRIVVGNFYEPYWVDSTYVTEVPVVLSSESTDSTPNEKEQPKTESEATLDPENKVSDVGDFSQDKRFTGYENLVKKLTEYKDADQENFLFKTLQSTNPFYGVQKIATVKVMRIQSSDLLKLTYTSSDPAVCMQTLKILSDVFKSQYQSITAKQTGLVSDYFRQRVGAAKKQLDSLEQDLLHFRMTNRIINYDEQTKFISEQKEVLERDWYEEAGKFSAAKTALTLVEENLGEKDKSLLQNKSIIDKRQRVYELALEISMEEIKEEIDIASLTRLKGELERLKRDLNNDILKSFELNRTVQGLNVQSVLQKWLEKAIEVEESQARYNTLTERKNAFLKKYDEFAPLGSQLKKIEREINLAQQDYMNHLNNLNQSIMKQKNSEQSEIQIIDNPLYPIKANPSKRMFTVIIAFIAGLVLTSALIILLEFLDTSIKFPDRLEELSGLRLVGAFPKIPSNPDNSINYPLISSRSIDQIVQRISLEDIRQKNPGDHPFILLMASTREKEGKTFLASKLVEKLRASGAKVLYIKQRDGMSPASLQQQFNNFDQRQQVWDYEYSIPDNFVTVRNINELLRNYTFLTKGFKFLVMELPALLAQEYPANIVESGNLTILVCKATRTWNKADSDATSLYQSNIHHPVLALLNACQVDMMESTIGEIPRRRSFVRKLIKKIVNLDFKTREIT